MINNIRRALRLAIGAIICRLPLFKKYKLHLLSLWQLERKGRDKAFYLAVSAYWLKFEYLAEKDPDKREAMKGLMMGGKSGREWAKYYDEQPIDFKAKVGRLTYEEAYPLLPKLDEICSKAGETLVVIQVGSSSGREIAWLAERNPAHKYIGTDVYPEVIAYASEHHHLSGLSFQLCSAKEISKLLDRYQDQRKVVFSSGSLQYVQPEHLELLFDALSRCQKLEMLLLDPGSEPRGDSEQSKSSLWRGAFSYAHDYRFYAEKAGLITQSCVIIRPYFPYEAFPKHAGTIHYFYWAKTRDRNSKV